MLMTFKYKKTKYENLFEWHEKSNDACFYCNDKEGAPIALKLFEDERGICSSCLNAFEIGHLGVDRHVIERIHPPFSNSLEAHAWFKQQAEKSGCQMFLVDSIPLGDEGNVCFQYDFVHDIETYQRTRKEVAEKGITSGLDSLECCRTLEIHKDGSIHIVY
jgi:hypothetical protein